MNSYINIIIRLPGFGNARVILGRGPKRPPQKKKKKNRIFRIMSTHTLGNVSFEAVKLSESHVNFNLIPFFCLSCNKIIREGCSREKQISNKLSGRRFKKFLNNPTVKPPTRKCVGLAFMENLLTRAKNYRSGPLDHWFYYSLALLSRRTCDHRFVHIMSLRTTCA